MSSAPAPTPVTGVPRLNPFAFPSTTDSRFVLLILSVVGSTTYIYNWLAQDAPGYRQSLLAAAQGCRAVGAQADAALAAAISAGPLQDQTGQLRATQAYMDCIGDFQMQAGLWSLSGLPVLAAVTILLYWQIPRWIIHRRGLTEMDREDAAEILESLADMSREVGVQPVPVVLGAAGYRSTDALAFGLPGKRFIGIDNGLVTRFYTEPRQFRAVVLHELAHIHNGDIDRAYLTIAVTIAFVLVGLVPLVISVVGQPLDVVLGLLVRAVGLLLLVILSAAAVLRARECYADVRASTWRDAAQGLRALFDASTSAPRSGWQRALSFHLAPEERRSVVDDTRPLFRAEIVEAFATGLAVALVLPRIITIVSNLTVRANLSVLASIIAAVLLAPPLVGVVGLGIWRATFASIASGVPRPRYGRLAMALAAGLVLGDLLAFDAFIDLQFDVAGLLVLKMMWGILAGVLVYGFLRWAAAGGAAWLSVALHAAPPRRVYLGALLITTLVLVDCFALLFFVDASAGAANGLVQGGPLSALGRFLLALGGGSFLILFNVPLLTGLALVALWAYPLAPALWQHAAERQHASDWAFLDSPPARPHDVVQPTAVVRALKAGLVAALVFAVADVVLNIAYGSLSAAVRAAPETRILFFESNVALALVLEAGVAGYVAGRLPRLKIAHALLAAFVSGCLSTASFHIINVAYGGSLDPMFVLTSYLQIVAMGALVAFATSGIVAAYFASTRP